MYYVEVPDRTGGSAGGDRCQRPGLRPRNHQLHQFGLFHLASAHDQRHRAIDHAEQQYDANLYARFASVLVLIPAAGRWRVDDRPGNGKQHADKREHADQFHDADNHLVSADLVIYADLIVVFGALRGSDDDARARSDAVE